MKTMIITFLVLNVSGFGATCSDHAAQLSGARGQSESSVRAGLAELKRYVRITRMTSQKAKEAEEVLEAMDGKKMQRLLIQANQKLQDRMDLPKVANNFEHVSNQHLKPLEADAKRLQDVFGIDSNRLELLMALHDLGKVEIPENMLKALTALFPNDFVAREILSHEYASMYWIDKLGKDSGLDSSEVLALQRLISNHNFGPDLTRAGNEELRTHWWPSMYASKFIPKLAGIGIEMDQYPSAEEGLYSTLLSAYDRAIANEYNQFGISTWQKFAEQDYNTWQSNVKSNPSLETPFTGPSLVNRMKTSAAWAESEIDNLWNVLASRYVSDPSFNLETFEPYRKQKEGITRLRAAIEKMEKDNPVAVRGSVNFRSEDGTLYRVEDKSEVHPTARVLKWDGKSWTVIQEGQSPVRLLFGLK